MEMFDVGDLLESTPVPDGIENSNYFVTTVKYGEKREFVLTIMENLDWDEVPFFNSILGHLGHFGLPVPAPQKTLDGMTLTTFCGKPTVLFPRLPGRHTLQPDPGNCASIGKVLAEIHTTLAATPFERVNPYDDHWMVSTIARIESLLDPGEKDLLESLADHYSEWRDLPLPRGIIHGDLFRDNALFVEDRLTGVIDFYHACTDFLVQDIAITINDWCRTSSGTLDEHRLGAFLEAYESVRPLETGEREYLPAFQRIACARFSLTRFISGGDGTPLKDPREFLRLIDILPVCR